MPALLTVAGLAGLAVLLGSLQAPSLVDAAREAEERRRATDPPKTFTADDLSGVDWLITRAGLEVYANARAEIARIRRARPTLHARLYDASRDAGSLSDLVPSLEAESIIVEVLKGYGMTPRQFLRREQTILSASAWAERRLPQSVKEPSSLLTNVQFVRNNREFVRGQASKYQQFEGSSPWWNAWRFVEEP